MLSRRLDRNGPVRLLVALVLLASLLMPPLVVAGGPPWTHLAAPVDSQNAPGVETPQEPLGQVEPTEAEEGTPPSPAAHQSAASPVLQEEPGAGPTATPTPVTATGDQLVDAATPTPTATTPATTVTPALASVPADFPEFPIAPLPPLPPPFPPPLPPYPAPPLLPRVIAITGPSAGPAARIPTATLPTTASPTVTPTRTATVTATPTPSVRTVVVMVPGIVLFDEGRSFDPYARASTNFAPMLAAFGCPGPLATPNTALVACSTNGVPNGIAWLPYSYQGLTPHPVSGQQVPAHYTGEQTTQHLQVSANFMTQIVGLIAQQAPGASVVVIGHSLGGAVSTFWGGVNPQVPVVTLDSPVNGIYQNDRRTLLVYCNNSVGLWEVYQIPPDYCNILIQLRVFTSAVANDLRDPAVVRQMGSANALNFANTADGLVTSWLAINPASRRGAVLITDPCPEMSQTDPFHHGCVIFNNAVIAQVANIVRAGAYPAPSVIRRTINLNISVTHNSQPAASAQVTVSHNGGIVAQGTTSAQGTLMLTVPWTDLLVTATYSGLVCNVGVLPANNTDLNVPVHIGCSQ